MRTVLGIVVALLILSSCEKEQENNFSVSGNIEGLKIGKILLQKIQDSSLVTLDSVSLEGNSNFKLSYLLEEPQMLYLYLDVKDGSTYDDRVSFFAEDTIMTFNSSLKDFEKDAVITGSKNQELLAVFNENIQKLNAVYTELMKRSMMLSSKENATTEEIEDLENDYDKYLKKRVLYALSYAGVHNDKEVAPYILLQEGFDANPKLLDSTFSMMPKKIQTSLYGKDLSEMIERLKNN